MRVSNDGLTFVKVTNEQVFYLQDLMDREGVSNLEIAEASSNHLGVATLMVQVLDWEPFLLTPGGVFEFVRS